MAHGSTDATGVRPDRLRTRAIELYCRELCGSERVPAAAADALQSLSPADAAGGDDQLLRVTRTAAARHVPRKAGPAGWRGMLTAEHERDCDQIPPLLAQSANRELPPAHQTKLDHHLAGCLFCRAAALREQRASRAFATVVSTGLAERRRTPPEPPASASPTEWTPPEPDSSAPPAKPQPAAPLPAARAQANAPAPPAAIEQFVEAPAREPRSRRGFAVYPAGRSAIAASRQGGRRTPAPRIGALAAYMPFLVTLALGALLIVGVSLALGGGSSGQTAAAQLPPPSASSAPPAAVGVAAIHTAPKSPRPPKPASTTPTTATTPTTTTTTRTSTTAKPVAAAPAATPAPSAAPPSPPAAPAHHPSPSHTPGNGGSSNSQPVVATQPGNQLPPQTAPTQGIGGGTSTVP